jgi:hypothetical protein
MAKTMDREWKRQGTLWRRGCSNRSWPDYDHLQAKRNGPGTYADFLSAAAGVLRFADAGMAATHVLAALSEDDALALMPCLAPACTALPARAVAVRRGAGSVRQASIAKAQRGAKRQPAGGCSRLGGVPGIW